MLSFSPWQQKIFASVIQGPSACARLYLSVSSKLQLTLHTQAPLSGPQQAFPTSWQTLLALLDIPSPAPPSKNYNFIFTHAAQIPFYHPMPLSSLPQNLCQGIWYSMCSTKYQPWKTMNITK